LEANKEKITARINARKKMIAAKSRAYRAANKEKIAAYRAANKEKIAVKVKAYTEANKERFSALERKRYLEEQQAKKFFATLAAVAAITKS
jgi:hypothetical protein